MSVDGHDLNTVTNTIAAAALGFNMTGKQPSDLYRAVAERLADAQLLMSPEKATELHDLRTRLAGMANPPREVFLALYDGAEPELFATVEAARECCDDLAKTDAGERYWDWTVNEHGVHVQFWTHPDDDRPLSETSGSVTAVVVQGAEPVASVRVGDRVEVTALEIASAYDEEADA